MLGSITLERIIDQLGGVLLTQMAIRQFAESLITKAFRF